MYSELSIGDQYSDLGMELDVPFVPTEEHVVKAMLDLAAVEPGDVLFDLGSGDGRIVVAAALDYGAQAVGVEIDAGRVKLAEQYAVQMGVENRVCFLQDDLFEVDFAPATVVTMYLLHTVNLDMRPRLLDELQPGTRIVSHAFDMGDWRPDRRITSGGISIYLWIIPARVAGTWYWTTAEGQQYRVTLEQRYQRLTGDIAIDGEPADLKGAVLWGGLLELVVQRHDAYEPESIVMHCRDEQLIVVGEYQKGAVARREPAAPF